MSRVWRSRALLDLAKGCPWCMSCGMERPVVAAHCNEQTFRGSGLKAPDSLVAFLCHDCHDIVDGRKAAGTTREERRELWRSAFLRTMAWLFDTGRVIVYGDTGAPGRRY